MAQTPIPTAGNANTTTQNPNAAPVKYACPQDSTDANAALRRACVAQINAYRATLNLAPLARWCGETTCVDQETSTDAASGTAHSAFGTCKEGAQDECPGWPLPEASNTQACLQMMWNEGPGSDYETHGHYINMSNPSYTMVECGFAPSGSNSFWAAQDFR